MYPGFARATVVICARVLSGHHSSILADVLVVAVPRSSSNTTAAQRVERIARSTLLLCTRLLGVGLEAEEESTNVVCETLSLISFRSASLNLASVLHP